jgi:aminoglycoside/choline kinase family phosphotransferase
MSPPRPELAGWIEAEYPGAGLEPIAGDASNRRFYRLRADGAPSRVVMDYGTPFEGETDDVRLTAIFREAALPVPDVLRIVPDPGCLLLEDLGREMLEGRLRSSPGEALGWLERGVDLAVRIADDGTAALLRSSRRDGPALDAGRFRFEMDFFLEHYVGGYLGRSPAPGLEEGLHELADRAAETPGPILCHRDYHSRNLMIQEDGALAMVDIQDARWGPDTYDFASLLYDAYVDMDDGWRPALVERYRCALESPPEPGAFRTRLRTVAVQRLVKALGTFGFQVASMGRARYEEAIPRTVSRLRRLLPGLVDLGGIAQRLERNVFLGGDGLARSASDRSMGGPAPR